MELPKKMFENETSNSLFSVIGLQYIQGWKAAHLSLCSPIKPKGEVSLETRTWVLRGSPKGDAALETLASLALVGP